MSDEEKEEENEGPSIIELLRERAAELESKDEFVEFLDGLADLCTEDDEIWEKRVVHFVRVVEDFLKHDLVDIPEDQDWRTLGKLFLIGAIEN